MRLLILGFILASLFVLGWVITVMLSAWLSLRRDRPDPELVEMSDNIEESARKARRAHIIRTWNEVQDEANQQGDQP